MIKSFWILAGFCGALASGYGLVSCGGSTPSSPTNPASNSPTVSSTATNTATQTGTIPPTHTPTLTPTATTTNTPTPRQFLSEWPVSGYQLCYSAASGTDNVYIAGGNSVTYNPITGWTVGIVTSSTSFGTSGTAAGDLTQVRAVGVDSSGNIYVVDDSNNRVTKFNSSGTAQWNTPSGSGTSSGSGNGQFDSPQGIAVDGNAYVYVADYLNSRIEVLSVSTGAWVQNITNAGMAYPNAVCFDSANSILYALDGGGSKKIFKFQTSGALIGSFGGTTGTGAGDFESPSAIAVNSAGTTVYVCDSTNNNVQAFSSSGTYGFSWGGSGTGNSQFGANSPNGIAIDSNGNSYVDDAGNQFIKIFAP